jgi:ABC transport system ATP-binding/permease protein
VLAKGGKVAFFGPPAEALDYFGKAEFADVFQLLNNDETTDWAARYAASPHAARHLVPQSPGASGRPGGMNGPPPASNRGPPS